MSISTAYAQDYERLKDLLALDIEELVTVTVASKREEQVRNAPGIISIVTADEIRRYGARNLRDIIDRTTNAQVIGSNLYPHGRTAMRGVAQTHIDNNVLLLLNGRPVRDVQSGGTNSDLYAAFPIDIIDKLEIIRGPGSVLYGTNAFSGVINIITKQARDNSEIEISTTYGSFNTKRVVATGGGSVGGFNFYGSINALQDKGDAFPYITDELGTVDTLRTDKSGVQAVL